MAQVKVIQPIVQQATKIRVAAYARVSSDSSDQQNSFAKQVEHYTKFIETNPDWVFADIYADAAITGTRADKRTEFQRLLQDCRAGKIDRVLVKAISRFARNSVDCIEAVRELSQLGVTVQFEKENINTATMGGEMLLSMLSAVAQEESLSISKNLQWGIQKRMRNGEFVASVAPYGYQRQGDTIVPDPQTMGTVQQIFDFYLSGNSAEWIVETLNMQQIPSPTGILWNARTVRDILKNEKYNGDSLLQKKYTPIELPLRKCLNHGERPQFYVSRTHEPIITASVFDAVQNLLKQRTEKHSAAQEPQKHLFSGLLVCRQCGATFRRNVRSNGVVWTCRNHYIKKEKCPVMPVSEADICRAFLILYNKLLANSGNIFSPMLQVLSLAREKSDGSNADAIALTRQISELLTQSHALSRLQSKACIDSATYTEKSNRINTEIASLRVQLQRARQPNQIDALHEKTTMLANLLEDGQPAAEFDTRLFETIITRIFIDTAQLHFELLNGTVLPERIKADE